MILSIGIDLVEVERIERAATRLGPRFLERLFTPAEIAYCTPRASRFVHYAGRFAAKEAALKALGTGWAQGISWRQIEILTSESGAPHLVLHGAALDRATRLGAARALVSISHTRGLAIAQVVLEGEK